MIRYEIICDRCGERFQDSDNRVWFEARIIELRELVYTAQLEACATSHASGWVPLEAAPFGAKGMSLFCKACWADFMRFYRKEEAGRERTTIGYEK